MGGRSEFSIALPFAASVSPSLSAASSFKELSAGCWSDGALSSVLLALDLLDPPEFLGFAKKDVVAFGLFAQKAFEAGGIMWRG